MADFIAMILTHEILKALFPYVIIIMLGVIISKANKISKKQDAILNHFKIAEEVEDIKIAEEVEDNNDDIKYF